MYKKTPKIENSHKEKFQLYSMCINMRNCGQLSFDGVTLPIHSIKKNETIVIIHPEWGVEPRHNTLSNLGT